MNRTYRSIWNETTGTFVAASELASSAGKKTSSSTRARGADAGFALKVLALSLMLSFGAGVQALPAGGVVAAGGASISTGALNTTVTQSTQNAAINWQSFNIGQTETVHFAQPNSNSVMLNRVLGSDPSSILGNLSANGKVFLVNPNGVLFGRGASVNVGGLVASTLAITDSDFMAGSYKFAGSSGAGVLNQGTINANGGYVALLGANVGNDGVISAQLGTVALAAGQAVTLDVAGDGLLNVTVNQGALNALAQNGGLIRADGGQVLLTAQSAGNLLQSAVNNTGVIQAQTLDKHNGTIRLLGGQGGTVSMSGTLDASGLDAGQTGGSVTVTGHHVGLFGGTIKASGDAGGGTVLIGGDYQGKNPALQNASATYMSADASISADAVTQGQGGKVVLWADDSTRAYGSISARGGAQGGDGGLIETSGHWLDVAGIKVNASAPQGQGGTWLLDPADVTITDAVTSSASPSGGTPNVFAPNSGASTANIAVSDIVTALATTSVTVNSANTGASAGGAGNITVAPTVTPLDWTASTTLTLNAVNDVNINGAITGTNGSLVANAAGGNVNVNAATKTTTGSLTFTARDNVNLNAATTVTTGNVTAVAGQNVNVAAVMTVTTGDIRLIADNDGTGPGAIVGGTVDITCGSNCLTITTGNLHIRFNPVSYATTGAEITAYDLNLTGAGVLDAKAWVFGDANDKQYDGTRAAIVNPLFKPDITSVRPPVALGAVSNALFDTKDVGVNKLVTFESGFTDPVFALFAPFGTAAGIGIARADITPAPLTVTAANVTKTYGDVPTLSAFSQVGLVAGETIGSVTETSAGQPAVAPVIGSPYDIVPSAATGGTFAPTNYSISYVNGLLTVNPAPLTVTASNVTKVFGTTPTLSGFSTSALVNGETVGSVTETSPGQPATAPVAGSPYAITPSAATGGTFTPSNYTIGYVNGVLTVTPAPLTITATDVSKVFGQVPALTAFTSAGLLNGDTVGSVTETSPGQPAPAPVAGSPYAITPSAATGGTFVPGNYTIGYVNGILTVTPAPLTITASNVSKVFGQTPALTAFTSAGLLNGDTVGSVTETSPGQPAPAPVAGSPYVITPSAATGGTFVPGNYTIGYVNGILTVTPAPLTITASNVSKAFGQTPALTAFTSAGLLNGNTVGSVTETSPGQPATAPVAGSPYAITPSAATGGTFVPGNYTIGYVNGVLTVTPTALTITANDASKTYGQTITLPTNAFTSTGLVNGDTVTSVTETSPGTVATAPVAGSPYPITPSAATGGTFVPGNYTIGYVDGVLTVVPAPVTPPVVTPPGVTSPGVTSPGVTPTGAFGTAPPGSTPTAFDSIMPVVTSAATPPQLLSVVSAPPPTELRPVAPPPAPVAPPPVVRQPAPVPEQPQVAPVRPRKQDRN